MQITKTLFKEFLDLPIYAWYHIHNKEKYEWIQRDQYGEVEMPDEDNFEDEGEEVEKYFLQLYHPEDILNISLLTVEEQESATKTAIDKRVPVIYQWTLSTPDAMTRFDILEYVSESDTYRHKEIKSKSNIRNKSNGRYTSLKNDLKYDISFSAYVLAKNSVPISEHVMVFLNKEYILHDIIDITALFSYESLNHELMSVTEVESKIHEINSAISLDLETLQSRYPYEGSKYKKYYAQKPPKWTIEILSGLSGERYAKVRSEGLYDLREIPSDKLSIFTPNQGTFITQYQKWQFTDTINLKNTLDSLEFPLYFYDYETYTSAIPQFQWTHPWQQVFCQYSIHKMEKNWTIEHYEWIIEDWEKNNHRLIDAMMCDLWSLTQGTFISWNEGFENGRNEELMEMYPEHSSNLHYMIKHTFDLMLVFKKWLYFEPDCQGSSSLKAVLPALTEITYESMPVWNGMEAMRVIEKILAWKATEKEISDCLTYCEQDTWAMVAIYKKLLEALNR